VFAYLHQPPWSPAGSVWRAVQPIGFFLTTLVNAVISSLDGRATVDGGARQPDARARILSQPSR
jgi:hypothetical protein